MKKVFAGLILVLPLVAFAKPEKVNWKACKKEIEEYCTTADSDEAKHECIEEIAAGKASKACVELNKKQEGKFKHKEDGHSHGH